MLVNLKTKKIIVVITTTLSVLIFCGSTFSYFYIKENRPRVPNVEKGQIYPRRMQQPYDVYITDFEWYWLDSGISLGGGIFITAYLLNQYFKKNFSDYKW